MLEPKMMDLVSDFVSGSNETVLQLMFCLLFFFFCFFFYFCSNKKLILSCFVLFSARFQSQSIELLNVKGLFGLFRQFRIDNCTTSTKTSTNTSNIGLHNFSFRAMKTQHWTISDLLLFKELFQAYQTISNHFQKQTTSAMQSQQHAPSIVRGEVDYTK